MRPRRCSPSRRRELPDHAPAGAASAGPDGAGGAWLAIQRSHGAGPLTEVAKVHHPALGLRAGDIVILKAAGVPTPTVNPADPGAQVPPPCVGTRPPGTRSTTPDAEVKFEFEVAVADIVPPDASHPGGALLLAALP